MREVKRKNKNIACFSRSCLIGLCTVFICGVLFAQDAANETPVAAATVESTPAARFTESGADTCLRCHDPETEPGIRALFNSPHGQAVKGTPFAKHQCETCHGEGSDHAKRLRRDEARPLLQDFHSGPKNAAKINALCLSCHQQNDLQNSAREHWQNSAHELANVACTDCHRIHTENDAALQPQQNTQLCESCHSKQKMQANQISSHPLHSGGLSCVNCHAVHGSTTAPLLAKESRNELCVTCHADKRGPFLWEHAPVAEDCGLCHQAHGSNHRALLTQTPPLLCQSCHDASGHPSLGYGAQTADAVGSIASYVRLRSCTNCHSQVHGSNHPSGAELNR